MTLVSTHASSKLMPPMTLMSASSFGVPHAHGDARLSCVVAHVRGAKVSQHSERRLPIAEVDLEEACFREHIFSATRAEVVQNRDFVAVFEQRFDDVATDEPGAARSPKLACSFGVDTASCVERPAVAGFSSRDAANPRQKRGYWDLALTISPWARVSRSTAFLRCSSKSEPCVGASFTSETADVKADRAWVELRVITVSNARNERGAEPEAHGEKPCPTSERLVSSQGCHVETIVPKIGYGAVFENLPSLLVVSLRN